MENSDILKSKTIVFPTKKDIEAQSFIHRPNSKNIDDNIGRNNWVWGALWAIEQIKELNQ